MAFRSVTPGYFTLLGQTISEGRDIRSTDSRDAARVAVVNRAFAEQYFPHTNPIGKKIWTGPRDRPPNEIIGVVTNGRTSDLTRAPQPEVYFSLWQAGAFSKPLVVRTAANPRSVIAAIHRELRSVDPTVAVENAKTLKQIRDDSLASRAFAMQLLAGFSIVGCVFTLVGIFGVLALSVASRCREIAIRAAMGAERRHIRNLVFAEGCRLITGGVASGVATALLLCRVLESFLFGVGTTDPATFVAVGLLFAGVALLACWIPMRRAAAVNPAEALRCE
jgi:putative ABC transport system permease protein